MVNTQDSAHKRWSPHYDVHDRRIGNTIFGLGLTFGIVSQGRSGNVRSVVSGLGKPTFSFSSLIFMKLVDAD